MTVRHPTVSRRHAQLTVGPEGATVTDLGSRNGTRVDGRATDGETPLGPGATLELGGVTAVLEEVLAADLEPAIELPTPVPVPTRTARSDAAPSTLGPASLETFVLGQLPRLVDRLASGDDAAAVAQAVGAALLASLPCRRVSVSRGGEGGSALLFSGSHDEGGSGVPVAEEIGDGWRLEVELVSDGAATRYAPLVTVGAGLVRAALRAGDPAAAAQAATAHKPPRPPDPPSLVPAVQEVYARAARVAASDVTVLILGESGTGKELLARYLHAASGRAARPLVALNCAALSRDLLEAELFGVERGVATGVEARPGVFEAAHGGTLFLDEIGDMAPETQARILRVLEAGEVYRVGGQTARPARVRVIAATNLDLDAMVASGRFRQDLYHRIADWVVELPPLRRRRRDIPNLAAHFLVRAAAARGVRPAGISRAAVEALTAYDWPGNVRELEKEIGRAALFLEDDELLDTTDLRPAIATAALEPPDESLKAVRECAERQHIRRVLADCDGSVPAAAARLDVGVSTLYARMKALGLDEERERDEGLSPPQ